MTGRRRNTPKLCQNDPAMGGAYNPEPRAHVLAGRALVPLAGQGALADEVLAG
jgi:hypothetical protein